MRNKIKIRNNKMNLHGLKRFDLLPKILACPTCKNAIHLDLENSMICCFHCNKKYPIINDIPIMMEEGQRIIINQVLGFDHDSQRMSREFTKNQSTLEKIYRLLQPPRQPYFGERKEKKISCLIDSSPDGRPVLEIGSGIQRTDARLINLDISSFPNVDVVGVGERLPFLDNTFSVIVSQAVLEHVPKPDTVVSEIYRVLKPGGYLYAEVPGVVPYHGFPAHYQNFTREGLKELFHDFELVEQGVVFGPSSALAWLIKEYFGLFFPNFYVRAFIHTLTEWLLHPLNYLDFFLHKSKYAYRMAMTLYFIGRKSM